MKMHEFNISEVEPLSEQIPTDPNWGEFFGHDSGFCVRLTGKYFMSVFIDRRLTLGTDADRFLLINTPEQIVAHCVSCVGELWQVRAEPTAPGKVGMVIYTSKGKALAAGEGSIEEGGIINYTVKTLYPGMTNRPKVEIEGKGKITSKGGANRIFRRDWSQGVGLPLGLILKAVQVMACPYALAAGRTLRPHNKERITYEKQISRLRPEPVGSVAGRQCAGLGAKSQNSK
jgi:hypothetical protein